MIDCILIGGGIIGLFTARELSDAGVRVALLERKRTGREASWAGGGILSPLYPWRYGEAVNALVAWSQSVYPGLSEQLREETGIDPEFTRNGLLVLDPQETEKAQSWGRKWNSQIQSLLEEDIPALEPGLGSSAGGGLWMPAIGQVRNPRLVESLRQYLQERIDVREEMEVEHLLIESGRVRGVDTNQGKLFAERVIVCAGAWTRNLLGSLGNSPLIEPVRGQMILYEAVPGLVNRILLHRDHYLIPRRDGRILVGSTLEHRGFEKETTQEARSQLEAFAVNLFPALEEYPVTQHWAGLRPGSPHGVPYIGSYPGVEGLYVNSGHFRNGLVLAPASARLLADLILEREPIVDPRPYGLDQADH